MKFEYRMSKLHIHNSMRAHTHTHTNVNAHKSATNVNYLLKLLVPEELVRHSLHVCTPNFVKYAVRQNNIYFLVPRGRMHMMGPVKQTRHMEGECTVDFPNMAHSQQAVIQLHKRCKTLLTCDKYRPTGEQAKLSFDHV